LVSIPNGQVATMNIQNLRKREKRLFRHSVRLRCESTATSCAVSWQGSARCWRTSQGGTPAHRQWVRFIRFADSSFELEVYVYVLVRSGRPSGRSKKSSCWDPEGRRGQRTRLALPAHVAYLTGMRAEGTAEDNRGADRHERADALVLPRASTKAVQSGDERHAPRTGAPPPPHVQRRAVRASTTHRKQEEDEMRTREHIVADAGVPGRTKAMTLTPVVGTPQREYAEMFVPGRGGARGRELRVTVLAAQSVADARPASASILVEVGNAERDLLVFDLGPVPSRTMPA